jgi:hypothetical protein
MSFTTTYRAVSMYPVFEAPRGRAYSTVELDSSSHLPFEIPHFEEVKDDLVSDHDFCPAKFLFDNAHEVSCGSRDSRLAVLLVDNNMSNFYDPYSFWLALKPAYEQNGRQYYYREGVMNIWGSLQWHKDWASASRDEIWLV